MFQPNLTQNNLLLLKPLFDLYPPEFVLNFEDGRPYFGIKSSESW